MIDNRTIRPVQATSPSGVLRARQGCSRQAFRDAWERFTTREVRFHWTLAEIPSYTSIVLEDKRLCITVAPR